MDILLRPFNLFIVFIYTLSFSYNDATPLINGPTQAGRYIITPSTLISPVKIGYPVPLQVEAIHPNGSRDTNFFGQVSLNALKQSISPIVLLHEPFDTPANTWLAYDSSRLNRTLVTTTSAARTGSSLMFTGFDSTRNGFCRGLGDNRQPVRISWYVRVTDPSVMSGGVTLSTSSAEWATYVYVRNGIRTAYWNKGFLGIGAGEVHGSATSHTNALEWYKVDLVLKWSSKRYDIYVNDVLRLQDWEMYDRGGTKSAKYICMWNQVSTTSWIDELLVLNSEPTFLTIPNLAIGSITLAAGFWSGTVSMNSSETSVFIRAMTTASSPTTRSVGVTQLYNVIPGCPHGRFSSDYHGECQLCSPGTYSNQVNTINCAQCPAGQYQPSSGQSSCFLCPINHYNPDPGAESIDDCLPCEQGTAPMGSSFCEVCPPGQFKHPTTPCENCPVGTYGLGDTTCLQCPAGTYNDEVGKAHCKQCPVGTYRPTNGATNITDCIPCSPGTYNNAEGRATCNLCPTGSYATSNGALECTYCAAGTRFVSTTQSCVDCAPGSYSIELGSLICHACTYGYYNNASRSSQCFPCPAGHFSPSLGSSFCQPCPPGRFSMGGKEQCDMCSEGTYMNDWGADSCIECDAGESSDEGATDCQPCQAGFYNPEPGFQCVSCPTGYSSEEGATNCTLKCGNGILDSDEGCDDGNLIFGDGCSETCTIEPGWVCIQPGQPCIPQVPPPIDNPSNVFQPETKTKQSSDSNMATVMVAIIIPTVFLFGFIILALFIYFKRKQRKEIDPLERGIQLSQRSSWMADSFIQGSSGGTIYDQLPSARASTANARVSTTIKTHVKNSIEYSELQIDRNNAIGRGGFGVVYRGKWRAIDVAVKEIKKEMISKDELVSFIEEAEIMKQMTPHPNVVLFLGIVDDPFCIVTEYMENGDLKSYLRSSAVISYSTKLIIIKNIAAGMLHLTAEGIVHRDLAARNILLNKSLQAKVSDFGLSRITDTSNVVYSTDDVMPLKWMSPEAIRKKKYSEKSDVWAFGVTCFEILARQDPYPHMDSVQAAAAVISEGLTPEMPHEIPGELTSIIKTCWTYEPEERPTFKIIYTSLEELK